MHVHFGALCDDFYISTRLHLKLELELSREAILHFFDRVRREYPAMRKFRRRDDGALVLEESDGDDESYRWLRVEPTCLRFGHCLPPDADAFHQYARFLLEQAPYHLTISEIDVDHLETVFGFDLEYRGNHDQLVAETFFADHPLSAFVLGEEAVHAIDCQPYIGISLTPACDMQAYVEVKSRTSTYEVRTTEYDQQALSVFLTVRKYWGFGDPGELAATHAELCRIGASLCRNRVVPIVVNPLAQAIASRP